MNIDEQLLELTRQADDIVKSYLPGQEGFQKTVIEAMNYSVRAGGKRLRPLLMQETYKLFGGGEKVIEPFMAAIEMIHTFSLAHDDLPCMDNDKMRRGLPTTWVKYGYDMAVLAGDGLVLYAMETAVKAFSLGSTPEKIGQCIGILAQKSGISGMLGGQAVDVELTSQDIPEDKLDFIYRLKTGALLEASMLIGAVLGNASGAEMESVERIASAIGVGFQIQDDILDLTGNSEVLGKPVLSDEKNQKTTFVSIHGLIKSRNEVERLFSEAIGELQKLPGDKSFLEGFIKLLIDREK